MFKIAKAATAARNLPATLGTAPAGYIPLILSFKEFESLSECIEEISVHHDEKEKDDEFWKCIKAIRAKLQLLNEIEYQKETLAGKIQEYEDTFVEQEPESSSSLPF